MSRALWIAFALSAALAVLSALAGWTVLHWIAKPAATGLLVAAVAGVLAREGAGRGYVAAIAFGLIFALAGDVFLMLPGDRFIFGLAAFFVTHLAYLWAFTRGSRLAAQPAILLGFAALAMLLLAVLWPGIGAGLRLPVIAYAAILALMTAQAVTCWRLLGGQAARLAALGAALFLFSDAMLALNRFRGPVPLSPIWVLASYYAAQALIAQSALATARARA